MIREMISAGNKLLVPALQFIWIYMHIHAKWGRHDFLGGVRMGPHLQPGQPEVPACEQEPEKGKV